MSDTKDHKMETVSNLPSFPPVLTRQNAYVDTFENRELRIIKEVADDIKCRCMDCKFVKDSLYSVKESNLETFMAMFPIHNIGLESKCDASSDVKATLHENLFSPFSESDQEDEDSEDNFFNIGRFTRCRRDSHSDSDSDSEIECDLRSLSPPSAPSSPPAKRAKK